MSFQVYIMVNAIFSFVKIKSRKERHQAVILLKGISYSRAKNEKIFFKKLSIKTNLSRLIMEGTSTRKNP